MAPQHMIASKVVLYGMVECQAGAESLTRYQPLRNPMGDSFRLAQRHLACNTGDTLTEASSPSQECQVPDGTS